MKYKVENLEIPTRLDLYILTINPTLTRSSAKKIVINQRVLVNNEIKLSNYRVRNGDVIEILLKQDNANTSTLNSNNDSNRSKLASNKDVKNNFKAFPNTNFDIDDLDLKTIKATKLPLRIIYEDNDIIVIDKKAGVVVHPVYKHMDDTLINGLAYYFSKKRENVKIRAVHRLDKETSGVIVFSKNLKAHEALSSQFVKREISKIYYAVVIGDFKEYLNKKHKDSIEIISYIKRMGDSLKRKYVSTNDQKGDISITNVSFVRYWEYERLNRIYKNTKFSLLRVEPKTGRTHQIRVHLSESGFPILGDIIYSESTFKRMMLHAKSIKLKLLDNSIKTFTTELPSDFD